MKIFSKVSDINTTEDTPPAAHRIGGQDCFNEAVDQHHGGLPRPTISMAAPGRFNEAVDQYHGGLQSLRSSTRSFRTA